MGSGCKKVNSNVYFLARKNASAYNEKLGSREGASELLGISVSTLADYELGNTKFVPVDKVVLMADLYNAPELMNGYCKHECPIGKEFPIATKCGSIERITAKIIRDLDDENIKSMKKKLVEIAADEAISSQSLADLVEVMGKLDKMRETISELKLVTKKLTWSK